MKTNLNYIKKEEQFEKSTTEIEDILENSNLSEIEKKAIMFKIGYVVGMYQGEQSVVKNIINAEKSILADKEKLEILTKIFND